MSQTTKMTGIQKIMLQLQTKGGMLVDADTAPAKQLEIANREGWTMTHQKTGKTWVWVETVFE